MTENRINTFISIFPAINQIILYLYFENPKINKDLIYNYRGIKTKAPFNTSGWNSFMLQAK